MTQPQNSNGKSTPSIKEDHVIVGRIRGPLGLRGDVRIEVFTDFPERFNPGNVLYLGDEPAKIESSRKTRRGLLIKLDLVKDRNDAEKLYGHYLTVPENDLDQLPEGSYYQFEIVGMEVWSDEGELLGAIKDILPTGSNDVYIVAKEGRKDLLIPAIKDVVLTVDTDKNRMTVNLLEGLR